MATPLVTGIKNPDLRRVAARITDLNDQVVRGDITQIEISKELKQIALWLKVADVGAYHA